MIIFDAGISSSVLIENKKKYIFTLDKSSTNRLDDIILNKYSINSAEQQKKNCLSLHYYWANSYIFGNGIEIYNFNTKKSERNAYSLYLLNVLKDCSVDNSKRLNCMDISNDFSIDYDS